MLAFAISEGKNRRLRKRWSSSISVKIYLAIFFIRFYSESKNIGGAEMKTKVNVPGIILFAVLFMLSGYHDAWSVQKTVRVKVPGIT